MSDFLENLLAQARGLDWESQPEYIPPTALNTVMSDTFDRMDWEHLKQTPAIRDMTDRLTEEFEEAPPAIEDLFNMLHKEAPQFRDPSEMDPGYTANHGMLKGLFESEEFQELRKESMHDEYATLYVIVWLEPQIYDAFMRVAEKREEAREAAEKEREAQEALNGAIAATEAAEQAGEGQDEAEGALQVAITAAIDAHEALQVAIAAQDSQMEAEIQGLIDAANGAKENLDAENELLSGYGIGPGELKHMSYEERRKLVDRLSKGKLAEFAKRIGSERQFADVERRRKVKQVPSEVYDYELGRDLTMLVPEEMNNLAIPELEEQFWLRYTQHALLQKKVRGPEKQGQGPILVVCDESGSMGQVVDAEGNTREAWSKAITLALADQARRGKRDFIYIGFSFEYQQWRLDFPGGHTPIDKVTEFVTHFFNGGTHYERPLTQALEIVDQYAKQGKPKPDIVFITDDDCSVDAQFIENWRKAKDEIDIKVYGVQIGGSDRYGNMRKLADWTTTIEYLNSDPEVVVDLYRQI